MKKILLAVSLLFISAVLFAQDGPWSRKPFKNNGKTYNFIRLMQTSGRRVNGVTVTLFPTFLFYGTDTLTINGLNLEGDLTTLLSMTASMYWGISELTGHQMVDDTTTAATIDRWTSKPKMEINGLSIGTGGAPGNVTMNGASIGVFDSQGHALNGVSITGGTNFFWKLKGVSIAGILNLAYRGEGVQIGLINVCKDCTGVQVGLINKMGKRIIPVFNMRSKRSK